MGPIFAIVVIGLEVIKAPWQKPEQVRHLTSAQGLRVSRGRVASKQPGLVLSALPFNFFSLPNSLHRFKKRVSLYNPGCCETHRDPPASGLHFSIDLQNSKHPLIYK